MNTQHILKYIGKALQLEALFMALSAAVSAYNGFDEAFLPLVNSAVLSGIVGIYPSIFVSGKKDFSTREGYYVVALSWIFCCIFGSFPFFFYGIPFTDSMFESVSGFTTTGASILSDIEALPQGLLFWRMSTAWIGGIGIISLFSLIAYSSRNRIVLTGAETSDIAISYSSAHKRTFVNRTVLTYTVLTVISLLALKLSGMRWFDAATHAMSASSTCGFSTRNESIAAFDNPVQELVLVFTMILASIRFELLGGIFTKGGVSKILRSEITRTFILMIAAATLAMTVSLYYNNAFSSAAECLRSALFQVSSIFTTTGFSTEDTNRWPVLCKAILVAGSLVCGCSGSTSGGIKVDRLVTLWKETVRKLRMLNHPNRVISISVEGRIVGNDTIVSTQSFVFCYLVIAIIGAFSFLSMGIDMETSWTASLACISNVGPGMGSVGSMSNYAFMPGAAKWISMALMLLGRLEIYPLLCVLLVRKTK